MHILIVTKRAAKLAPFAEALARATGLALRYADSWTDAMAVFRERGSGFAVLDEGMPEGAPLELARQAIQVNAAINLAVVSPLAAEAFHEASEGLGILAAVPQSPAGADGAALARMFTRFLP
jgi:DNA-binding NtrC family response regulator